MVGIGEDFHRQVDDDQLRITYVHTTQRETLSIHEALEKVVVSDKLKLILNFRTQMVENSYRYFELDL
jgi:hypothetical protein